MHHPYCCVLCPEIPYICFNLVLYSVTMLMIGPSTFLEDEDEEDLHGKYQGQPLVKDCHFDNN